ncbi:YcaO-like family protein [Nonomuraea longispora]|uniref:YcaO-like family protein n=1 Tax=Nonomuraea longispora TaxID=1848320 RepID=UPI00140482E5|nr:YcaO-like family protein [Nonomuraea longispora]
MIAQVSRDRTAGSVVPSLISYTATGAEVTGGAALGDDEAALRAAVGEAVERHCANQVPSGLRRATYRELDEPAVDPRSFALYSPAQYRARGFPFVPMTADLEIAWSPAEDLVSGGRALVPASLVYVNYFTGPRRAEPATNYPILAGTAAAATQEQARQAALREVLERDAVTLWWHGSAPASPLKAPAGGPLAEALGEAAESGLTVSLLRIPAAFDAIVAAVFVEDRARRIVGFGSACRATEEGAAAKAFTEAIGTYETGRILLRRDIARPPYLRRRADRRYLDDLRRGWRDVNDVRLHVQVYLDERLQGDALDRLRHPSGPPMPPESLGPLRSLTDQGLRAYAVDLSSPDSELHVARVLVPGLVCDAPAAFPFLGSTRLPASSDLVRQPLPFA